MKFLINSHVSNTQAVDLLLSSLRKCEEYDKHQYIVCAGGHEPINTYEHHIDGNVTTILCGHNSIDFTAFITAVEYKEAGIFTEDDHYFYMHDTCLVGKDFLRLVEEKTDLSKQVIPLLPQSGRSKNIGLYSHKVLMESRKFLVTQAKNTDYSKTDQFKNTGFRWEDIMLKTRWNGKCYHETPDVLGKNRFGENIFIGDIFNNNTDRLAVYFTDIDLIKTQANCARVFYPWECSEHTGGIITKKGEYKHIIDTTDSTDINMDTVDEVYYRAGLAKNGVEYRQSNTPIDTSKIVIFLRGHVKHALESGKDIQHMIHALSIQHDVHVYITTWDKQYQREFWVQNAADNKQRAYEEDIKNSKDNNNTVNEQYILNNLGDVAKHVKHIQILNEKEIDSQLIGNVTGRLPGSKCQIAGWKRMWAQKYIGISKIYEDFGSDVMVVNMRFDLAETNKKLQMLLGKKNGASNPHPTEIIKRVINKNLKKQNNLHITSATAGCDNFYIGSSGIMRIIVTNFHKRLDIMLKNDLRRIATGHHEIFLKHFLAHNKYKYIPFEPMKQKYITHLCTFMGRRENVSILLKYIEQALRLNALDNYWMIDMTRCIEDHEYIYAEQQRLNELFPGRVHIYNREKRAEELKDPDAIKSGIGSWSTFYKFLTQFTDNDIIAKCDDDTLFIDVETLAHAFSFRADNKQPYLMHANCVNNGVAAYHQHHKRGGSCWENPEVSVYPSCGLTGPLFSFPEIACDHHEQFTSDISDSKENLAKYKLYKNPLFTQRVSINFIFMLGSDRHSLSTIDLQDEYETSSKKPQAEDRPNCIIGDFIVAHHTYGVQEPVMEARGTIEKYRKLADSYLNTVEKSEKIVSDKIFCGVLKSGDDYVMKHPATCRSIKLQHKQTGKWLSVGSVKKEKIKIDKDRNKIGTGKYMLENMYTAVDQKELASILEVDLNNPTLLEFNNSNKIIRTGGSRRELNDKENKAGKFYPAHMIAKFFQGGYKTETVKFIKTADDTYTIQSTTNPNHWLNFQYNQKRDVANLRWVENNPCEFVVHNISEKADDLCVCSITRCEDSIMNDGTYYTVNSTGEKIIKPREFYWMVDHHIWQFILRPRTGEYHVALIADNLRPRYLAVRNDQVVISNDPFEWKIEDEKLQYNGRYVTIEDNHVVLTDTETSIIKFTQ